MSSQNLEISFGGELHEIDADLFVESLLSYSNVTQEVSAFMSPQSKVNIKIRAPKQGSFIMLLSVVADEVKDLFSLDNITYASGIITVVAGLYKFRLWVSKNGKPEKVKHVGNNNVEVTNNKKSTIIIDNRVFNIYQDSSRVRENLRRTFVRLKDKQEIQDFMIRDDKQNELFKIEKKDFELMSSDQDEIEQKRQIELKEHQELSIFKVVFVENYKWEFFYQGNKIYASIKDRDFFDKIQKGEVAFRSGDKIIADIEIEQVFNEAANTFVNDSYSLTKIIEHIPRNPDMTQTSIEIGDLT